MKGTMKATYKVLCDNDINVEVTIGDIFNDEDVMKVVRRKFAKSSKPMEQSLAAEKIVLTSLKQTYECEFPKEQYLDTLEICEEDARSKKLLKKGCDRIEVVDIATEAVKTAGKKR